ncbi:hypothetical protein [Ramlibacter humi]|uniref:Uncharacterized protein n=1 Tax=Ramlibacter humi TaxID=2530451 RepID=A0A4Z0C0E9_9BURK|nr:hypothetical protein [Ramlibacter humi]TFZ04018.1 hypothetical protein EZ216_10305 [Ramlibacter humi]
MDLTRIHCIKEWQVRHRRTHSLESRAWDVLLTVWVMGWIGWLPAYALDALWALPLCLVAMLGPDLYVAWRARWHRLNRLRCDWLPAASLPRRPHVRG